MAETSFQQEDVAKRYLEETRGGIPCGAAQGEIMHRFASYFCPGLRRVVDLGCGDGYLAKLFLRREPDVEFILVDHSSAMLESAKENLSDFRDRCRFLEADLEDPLARHLGEDDVDAVVSGFAIHHLSSERKQSLYQEIHACLEPGGVFVNADHVAALSPELDEWFEALLIEHLADYNQVTIDEMQRRYEDRKSDEEDILEDLQLQLEWLRGIGFVHVDCYFRWLNLTVFGGVRP